eukprot:1192963-Prorocentrum_minimum.AAC.1
MPAGSEVSSPMDSRTLSSWCRSPESKRYLCARFGDCVSITWNCFGLFNLLSLSCVLSMRLLSSVELARASLSLSCSSVGVVRRQFARACHALHRPAVHPAEGRLLLQQHFILLTYRPANAPLLVHPPFGRD